MKILMSAILALLLFGCASAPTQRLSPDTLSSLDGKSITVVARKSPSFVAMTSGKGMFAAMGAGAAIAAGNKLVRETGIEDPAPSIGTAFAEDLTKAHGARFAGKSGAIAESDDVSEVVQLAKDSDYALDVATHGWSYIYDGFKFSDYFVGYSANMRLIDVGSAQVVASGRCAYDPKKAGKTAVSHDRLLENDAAYIKQELAAAAEVCVQQLSAAIL